ncbi:hypothetical protein DQK91_18080 [Oceanidesulfovibrio marinus]|uniref:Uncharacterized protein n=2 Tax=Oceanidesulfovibrio marinus TaxID=370038 RepID=A0A6P1ZDD6_9BACT|nr:hypothetical protein DQK91_18080 [Oceanidesulfovibrio marinus]
MRVSNEITSQAYRRIVAVTCRIGMHRYQTPHQEAGFNGSLTSLSDSSLHELATASMTDLRGRVGGVRMFVVVMSRLVSWMTKQADGSYTRWDTHFLTTIKPEIVASGGAPFRPIRPVVSSSDPYQSGGVVNNWSNRLLEDQAKI